MPWFYARMQTIDQEHGVLILPAGNLKHTCVLLLNMHKVRTIISDPHELYLYFFPTNGQPLTDTIRKQRQVFG